MPPLGLQGILFDLDGVIYNAEEPIAGAADALAWARRGRIPHLFVTNTTSRPRSSLVAKLARFGVEAREEQILTPAVAAVEWLRSQRPGELALLLKPEAQREFDIPAPSRGGRRNRRGRTWWSATWVATGPMPR